MATKYLKNNEGLVRAVTTDNLQLEKPLTNENYDVNVFNRNMDKVDAAIQEVKGKVDGLELTAERVSIADPTNKFEATNVEDALLENKTSILNLQTKVDNGQTVRMTEPNGACRGIPNNNANDISTTGFWMGENVANAPTGTHGWIYLESKVHNELYQNQIATNLHDSSKRWTRHKVGGSWSDWRSL